MRIIHAGDIIEVYGQDEKEPGVMLQGTRQEVKDFLEMFGMYREFNPDHIKYEEDE